MLNLILVSCMLIGRLISIGFGWFECIRWNVCWNICGMSVGLCMVMVYFVIGFVIDLMLMVWKFFL